jgi:hypothetical protein
MPDQTQKGFTVNKVKTLATFVIALALLAMPAGALAKSGDRDHDRLPDKWEKKHGLSTKTKSAKQDPDKDGLSNLGELRAKTDPKDADSDNDRLEDGDEDGDKDGVDNANELRQGTNPRSKDSDGDGVKDGSEDRDKDGLSNRGEDVTSNDPVDPDTDDDGVKDGDEVAGSILSFADGKLVIQLPGAGAGTIEAAVTDATEIKCETEDEHEDDDATAKSSKNGADDAPGDDRGGQSEPGDDKGGSTTTTEPGDDKGGSTTTTEPGDDKGGDRKDDESDDDAPGSRSEHDGDDDNRCGTADLVAGTLVHEAEIKLTSTGPVFEEIQLVK